MFAWLQNLTCACMSNKDHNQHDNDDEFDEDPLSWSKDLVRYRTGEFSMAAVQANQLMEDFSQVETGTQSLFFGIYDGHAGTEAAQYISTHLFPNLIGHLGDNNRNMSEDILRHAVADTESGFMTVVENGYAEKHMLGKVGSCCLAGLIWKGRLYIANLGDSRAVIGSVNSLGIVTGEQLTTDHNAKHENIRDELKRLHPNDDRIVFQNHGTWRVKGIIQVSRTIGDAYLKRYVFTQRESFPHFEEVPEPFDQAVLSSEPEILSREIRIQDKYLIFASDGFWEHMTNTEAVEYVHNNPPRHGIAKRLLWHCLENVVHERGRSYKDLQGIEKGRERRSWHDDITVIVVFLDKRSRCQLRQIEEVSYRPFTEMVVPSFFGELRPASA